MGHNYLKTRTQELDSQLAAKTLLFFFSQNFSMRQTPLEGHALHTVGFACICLLSQKSLHPPSKRSCPISSLAYKISSAPLGKFFQQSLGHTSELTLTVLPVHSNFLFQVPAMSSSQVGAAGSSFGTRESSQEWVWESSDNSPKATRTFKTDRTV